jgi:hypothetical protein
MTTQARKLRIPSVEKDVDRPASGADWLEKLQGFVKLATAAGGLVPLPYINTAGDIVTTLLQMLQVSPNWGIQTHSTQSSQTMNKNKGDLRSLALSIIDIVVLIRDEVVVRVELSESVYKTMCTDLNKLVLPLNFKLTAYH